MTIRVVYGQNEEEILRRILAAMRDPDVEQVTIHRPGSRFRTHDGREVILGQDGHPVQPIPVGAC